MAVPTFLLGLLVLTYLSSFVVFAILRIVTGISIQRIGYFSLRRIAYTPCDGFKMEIRGLGLNVHRPTFAQPTWLSIRVNELAVILDVAKLEASRADGENSGQSVVHDANGNASEPGSSNQDAKAPTFQCEAAGGGRSKTWKHLTMMKDKIKRLHRKLNWLRLVDVVAANSTLSMPGVGNIQVGSLTMAIDTRRKMINRARFFSPSRADGQHQRDQAEWIISMRSVLFTVEGGDSLEILDTATLNIHGFLYEALDGLRDASVALKLGRVHIPYDDVVRSVAQYKSLKSAMGNTTDDLKLAEATADKVMQELDVPGSTNHDLMQAVSDSKEFISSILRGIKEVQLAVSYVDLTKKVEGIKTTGPPILFNASMKEVGIDLHRLDPRSPAHRMYFPSKDIAHEALAAALSISVGVDDGQGKPERLVYIPLATTTVRTTLPSKTVELADEGTAEQRNANILFANSVVTSPSVDLHPRHLPLLLAMLRPKPMSPMAHPRGQQRHMLISRLLPKANVKFSMHEPVVRISLPPVRGTADLDDFDLIISSISSVSLDLESFHSAVEEMHYSLAATTRVQTHRLYYQTSDAARFDLLETDFLDLKVQLNASPDVQVLVTGALETLNLKMVRPEIVDGLRQIVRQLRLDVEPDKQAVSKNSRQPNLLRDVPSWLLQFQMQCSDCCIEVAGVDDDVSSETRGVALQLESWSAEYRAQRLDGLQRRASRRRAGSRASMSPDPELLRALPISPRKRYQTEGDGRRISVHVRGLEAYVVETAEKWEMEPFVNIPRFEVALSATSDKQGPIFHVHCHVRTLLVQYSLYRHYAIGVAATVLRKAFMRTRKDMGEPRSQTTARRPTPTSGHFSPGPSPRDQATNEADSRQSRDLIAVDFKATLIQIKADMPTEPPLMLQIYNMEVGRHRWSSPFVHAKLIRLYAEAPRMRRVWARMISIKNGRLDYRESRKKTTEGVQEERLYDLAAEGIRIAVPHEMIVHKISDNVMNMLKAVKQLHHRFKTGTNEYILDKGPEGPTNVPRLSLRIRMLMFEFEDGAFEWKLGVIYRAGRLEQMQRQAREEAFRVKVKRLHEEESKREARLYRARSARARGRSGGPSETINARSLSADGRPRSSAGDVPKIRTGTADRGRAPRYNPESDSSGMSGSARVSITEARCNLNAHNARSWKRRIDRQYELVRNGMKEDRAAFWGRDEIPDDMHDSEQILEVPHRPALMSTVIQDLHLIIDRPSFPLRELPEFMHKVGKGMPRDMQYSLLVPMNVQITMGEAKVTLRDYPLPLLHVPSLRQGQASRLAALSLKTDFVLAEEFRGLGSTRRARVQIIPPTNAGVSNEGAFAIDVRRTIGPVKSYSDMSIDINSANPTRFTWGPCYQPAIQDMMTAIESLTKPQIDPSERVGFWDKIRLTFHSCVRVAWRGDGDVHLALKGTRDPYHVTGNGAGFLMCWRNDVRWSVHSDDDPKRFMSVDSGEYVLAIPDYGREARKSKRQDGDHDGSISDSAPTSSAAFKKVVMKLSGKVQWLAGLVFERAIEQGDRNFEFKPHYEVVTKSPAYAKPAADLPYDAFRGFRSQHIHLSVAVRAPVDREWSSDNTAASRSYNAVHVTPRFFTHFFAWWSLFSGPMSLPIRQGALWPGRERNSKKFGRHLATIKYNLLLAPLFLSHIYKHKDTEDSSDNAVSATGIKVRFDSWMLDLHQRREEFNTRDRGRKTQSRTSGMKIHAAQLDLVSADIRAVSARIRGITTEAIRRNSISTFMTDQMDDGADLSHFTIPDHDFSWIDMDDFVELDWILPTEPNPDTKILPLVYAPRITYFRQTDIGGVIDGDPDRRSPFGQEATHRCIMSHDDNPEKVQAPLIRDRLAKIDEQMARNKKDMGDLELQIVRGDRTSGTARAELDTFKRYGSVLAVKKTFMEAMLRQMASRSTAEARGEPVTDSEDMSEPATDADKDETAVPAGTEFANDFKNRFVVHNMQLKWNNTLRNIILRYIHQVSQRRGFVYYLSRPAVKFILDIVEEQTRLKTAKNTSSGTRAGSAKTPEVMGSDRESQKDIEDRIRKILQEGKKYVNADDAQGTGDGDPTPVAMDDLSSGIAEGFTPQNSYHVRLIAPQIQLQSDKNKKHVVLITAKGMELKVVEVMDKERISDSVSGLVQRRFLVGMDSTQFFVTHQKWFTTQLVSLYAGSNYGTPHDSSWPPWVPMEVMFDFQTDPFGFKRVVQKTSATLRYEKYNTLRLKYNDEVNTGEGSHATAHDSAETRMDNLWVDFPQARALCNSSQYYAIYVIVLDLLMFSEPLEKTRSERLEKIKLASDFSDLRGAPEMVIKLQERIRQLEEIKTHFQVHSKYMDKKGWQDRLVLERDLAACEDELFFMMKAITTSQRKIDGTTGSSALLRWSITAKEIVWHLIRDSSEPLVELQLKNVEYDRTDNADGSHINLIQVGSVLGLNLLPDAIYPAMIAPYSENEKAGFELGKQPMIRVYWYMLEAIAGIPVMDHFEVNLFPMKIQLEREVGKKLFEYIFPGIEGDKPSESPLIIGQSLTGADADGDGDSLSEARDVDKERDKRGPLRPGSLDLRLRPTLTSEPKTGLGKSKALSVHSGDGASGFRLFRSGTGSKSLGNRKPSAESLRRSSKDTQPGLGRSSSGPSLKEAESHDSRRGARFGLNRSKGNNGTDDKTEPCDDLTKMIDRASNYMTFAYIKLPSVVLCLSYKGKGDRNLEDVHDFVFRLPTIEFRNKTWSNLDLALALKSRVIKALISHTGAIIGNKFSRHRPNTAQQSRLRELATSSVLLSSSTIPPSNSASQNPVPLMPSTDAHEHSDDSSSLFSSSTLDFSRSPPRASNRSANALSHRGSGSSIPAPTLASRESSAASTRSHLSTAAHVPHGQAQVKTQAPSAVPAFLMMTRPPTPRDRSTPSFAEFGSRGGDSRDGSSDPSIKRSSNGAPIPSGGSGGGSRLLRVFTSRRHRESATPPASADEGAEETGESGHDGKSSNGEGGQKSTTTHSNGSAGALGAAGLVRSLSRKHRS